VDAKQGPHGAYNQQLKKIDDDQCLLFDAKEAPIFLQL